MDEGGGELDTLLVAEGELHDLVGAAGGEAEAVGPAEHGVAGVRGGEAVELGEVGELWAHLHAGV